MPVRVKICGITSHSDALAALEAGADALGFIFFRGSARFIEPETAAVISRELPPFVTRTGVFVDESPEEIRRVHALAGLDAIQLHGAEAPEFCAALAGLKLIKAIRVKDQTSLDPLGNFPVSAFLLDSYVPGQLGGTGAQFNWDLALEAKRLGKPVILAGGLTPENVADAVAKVRPYGIDVSSGVESAPGRKDHARVREFVHRAKTAAQD